MPFYLLALAVLLMAVPAEAGNVHCAAYEDCRASVLDDAQADARHRCQSGSHDQMLACRDAASAAYRDREQSRCEALLAACGRSETNVTVQMDSR